MRLHRGVGLILCLLIAALAVAADNKPIPGIGPVGEIVKLHTGFGYTEGPAVDPDGNVYFTDLNFKDRVKGRILKVDTDGKLTTFLEDSNNCNGLMFDNKGRLLACQEKTGRIIAIDPATKAITVVADKFEDQPFKAPNDLVVDRQNGVYFTDMPRNSVYYCAPDGKVTKLISDAKGANGVRLSPDEKTLYSLPANDPEMKAYPVIEPGKIGEGKVFGKLEQSAKGKPAGGDGLTVDTKGNVYVTRPAMRTIQVMSPDGKTLGLIEFPEGPSNCVFGGKDMKTLYVTARTSLYTVKMEATGHRFATKGK